MVAVAGLCLAFATAHWWNLVVLLIAAVIGVLLFGILVHPPLIMWGGQLSDGTPTGGMEIGRRSFGFGLWLNGAASLAAAGICGIAARTQRPRP
ncbi:hypothetical protein SAMN04489752_3342 [Brevibacterium siliguriense]|uniref:Uncharacterized protein n=1 Tax=Brevibacterium siliguriense TaxID=1136497 RepID=A0A1H1XK25_9MICO|nr:hypothetical protein [Brevibacterium siliguriense]SDT09493.1 hypothetical protein SAMN04489752_3342 [Brevibacterium siliguriense]